MCVCVSVCVLCVVWLCCVRVCVPKHSPALSEDSPKRVTIQEPVKDEKRKLGASDAVRTLTAVCCLFVVCVRVCVCCVLCVCACVCVACCVRVRVNMCVGVLRVFACVCVCLRVCAVVVSE